MIQLLYHLIAVRKNKLINNNYFCRSVLIPIEFTEEWDKLKYYVIKGTLNNWEKDKLLILKFFVTLSHYITFYRNRRGK